MRFFMKLNERILLLFVLLVFLAAVPVIHGQAAQQQPATPEPQQGGDPIRQLNLTPEQREQNKTERAAINERLRESNRTLEEALNAENPDEALVEQRVGEVAAAQAAAMRMRILTEIRIRRVLTPEQRVILRSLQRQAKDIRRERLLANPDERQRRQEERSRALQNQRNGLGPILPQRQNP